MPPPAALESRCDDSHFTVEETEAQGLIYARWHTWLGQNQTAHPALYSFCYDTQFCVDGWLSAWRDLESLWNHLSGCIWECVSREISLRKEDWPWAWWVPSLCAGVQDWGKASWAPTFVSLGFLTVNLVYPAASYPWLHTFQATLDWRLLQTRSQNIPLPH